MVGLVRSVRVGAYIGVKGVWADLGLVGWNLGFEDREDVELAFDFGIEADVRSASLLCFLTLRSRPYPQLRPSSPIWLYLHLHRLTPYRTLPSLLPLIFPSAIPPRTYTKPHLNAQKHTNDTQARRLQAQRKKEAQREELEERERTSTRPGV